MILRQYLKFFINGGLLGLIAWGLQLLLFRFFEDARAPYPYALASALTYLPLVVLNFAIQKRFIFGVPGAFPRFVVANLAIMLLVAACSPVFKALLGSLLGASWGELLGFAAAAIVCSVPSFLLKRSWVFGVRRGVPGESEA
ncbi:GtrA family protein [Pseudomarimonas salicorniae]|uniref:GtrA family protein n=1 Tax=Pseudomarimonas salicorniae TaxID=2933270 RepID=A0ABT0GIU9_9GAMM|nr:GtrA family protein [Lysobacter sp. CAU 1642]MCK7594470.1 GtrA family protein [Lysobacter sp. CAU 1642]